MPAKQTGTGRRATPVDAIGLLKADHAKVSALFEKYEHSRQDSVKQRLAQQICDELTVHTKLEEEIFYPAVREAIGDDDLMDEATVEHAGAKSLISQLRAAEPSAKLFDAKVTVLSEYIKHHVKEEHTEMFPKARKSGADLKELGARMAARKKVLAAAK
ncbi:MAG TPA: hemerythrin domain-containing protein [Rhizomicrobium sp.]